MASRFAWPVVAALVFALQAWLALTHRPFVDEWQALQIAVQSPDVGALLENLSYEGHPPLWYLLLRGLSEVLGPYAALPAAALLLGFVTQYLILFESPFPRWARLLIALSEFVLFEFNTISRGYTLGVMLIFAIVAFWDRRRLVWFLIAMLPFTDFLFGVISVIFVWFRWQERSVWWPGLAFWVLLGLVSAWTVLPAPDVVPIYPPSNHDFSSVEAWLARVSILFFPVQGIDRPMWDMPLPTVASWTLWAPFLLIVWVQTRGRPADRVAMTAFLASMLAFFFFLYPLQNRHMMLAAVLLIALVWRALVQGGRLHSLFSFWLVLIAVAGLATAGNNLARPFDTAPETARLIGDLGLRDEHWAALPTQHGQGVSAMTGILFERTRADCMQDLIRWNQQERFATVEELVGWLEARARRDGRFYLLSNLRLRSRPEIVRIGSVPAGYDGKAYFLYEIGPGQAKVARKLPRCVPGMRPFTAKPMI
ncbi:hypothetical protein EKN06_09610 [Croceicoccus ponticola]|uniref:Glycosyltransferase RgtA/B/C/D-like domain-containing protein n=1 Tax=Croceicoccus ponticola TaxID=2217664 RepID=A0A437GXL5_9SPHN|nr:hypothetical protein [Croceicoccus ponticola]RVQ67155.1 hypothetical protein EKN06_09610 [Croceicoccus ponticola]